MEPAEAIVLNSHGVGQYAYCDHLPAWGETLEVHDWHVAEDGGKGSNVAVALGRLGVRCAFVGKVGRDPWGELGRKWMEDAGVNCDHLIFSNEVSTGTGLILVAPDGSNTIIDGDSSSKALRIEEVSQALFDLAGSGFFITGFEIPAALALKASYQASAAGMTVVLNPSPLPTGFSENLTHVDYLFVNESEACQLTNTSPNTLDYSTLAHAVKQATQAQTIVLTLGDKGVCAVQDDESEIKVAAVRPARVVNTAGAGDGFMAATVAELIRGASLKDALTWASGFAGLSVSIDGTIPSYRPRDEVELFIASQIPSL